ncbi:HAUS augmin-like complex subunit 6 N-terminus-domain-containing protein [Gamsiella multidivaricata]|uniref:HAUS augmin-like complex subunit 6 N-terminus-domain-containing protein n=1 Tax=Gamsiella multidivaricata TaxID=101098 RepID=UPI002220FEB4|nr:HAUS augmin-like complex subunit 6 N-terminus-domain-containing protein [Gamsiella multidivaricata]KAI7827170.1 HAUS augmin-like complex subunit 6 N-terminus-domain-containing protein [Gamsiella multidivaricata]
MSTFNPLNSTAANTQPPSSSQYLSSPENIRSIFFTNLILLGVQEHALKPSSVSSPPTDTPQDLARSRNASSQISSGTSRPLNQPAQPSRQQQHFIINSRGYGINTSKPLELHRHVFARGHQSTKALEFVLWFLFTRLDKAQAHDRFKECWPILDRHDAREFRNVAFKWLDELRKEGCFGIGHNIHPSNNQSTGLGLLLHTIRRSYLDDSIGDRTEQLVLVLSTYVLSRVVMEEIGQSQHAQGQERAVQEDEDRTLSDLVSQAPETPQDEETLMDMIDSHIVRRSRFFLQNMEQQRSIRQSWSAMSKDMTEKLETYTKELVCCFRLIMIF